MQSSSSSQTQQLSATNDNNNKLDSLPMESCLQVLEYLKEHRQEMKNPMFEAIISTSKQLFYSKQEKKDFKAKRNQLRKERKMMQQKQQQLPTLKQTKLKQVQVIQQHLSSTLSYQALLPPKENQQQEEEQEETMTTPLPPPTKCYVCKEKFDTMHHFYDRLCTPCGNFNFEKRSLSCNLTGYTALVTGGRIKIGFQIALQLLRNHCSQVIVTSRFPIDTLERYQKESDFSIWKDKLCILALDLRDLNAVLECCELIKEKVKTLDILINNAAQTIRRPIAFYETVIQKEIHFAISNEHLSFFPQLQQQQQQLTLLQEQSIVKWNSQHYQSFVKSVMMNQVPVVMEQDEKSFELEIPRGAVDTHGQQVDLRSKNSWTLPLEEVSIAELIETQTINSTAPFLLIQKLVPIMHSESDKKDRYIINVSSMEGNFARQYKSHKHPHTNMAKASLNMLTRTSAKQFAEEYQIFMNAVDTGWVTEEMPFGKMWFQRTVPLDEIDGAMRVLDPIFTKSTLFGQFLKDYKPYPW